MKPNLPKLLTLTLSLELILSPLAPAMAAEQNKGFLNTANQILNVTNDFAQTAGINTMGFGGGSNSTSGTYSNDFNMLQGQKSTEADSKVFNSALLKSKIPGLAEYLARHPANLDCPVLKPLNVVEPDICEPSGSGIPADPRVSGGYMNDAKTFQTHFRDIKLLYGDSSKEFQGAKSCMTKATNVLENFFNDKLSELDKLNNELSRMNAEFIKGAKDEKSEIALQTEFLDGKDNKLAADIDAAFRERETKKLQKEFGNAACTSLQGFKAEDILNKGGLRASKSTLTKNLDEKSAAGLSGATFGTDYTKVVASINKIANQASTDVQTKLGESGMGQNSLASIISGVSQSAVPDFGISKLIKPGEYSELNASFNKDLVPLNKMQSDAQSALSSFSSLDPSVLQKLADPNTTNFDQLLDTMTNKMKQECLSKSMASGNSSIDYFKKNSRDLTKSEQADKSSTYIFEDMLENILNNDSLSPDEKLSKIQAAKKDERRVMRQSGWFNTTFMGADGTQQEKRVAKSNITASDFFSDMIRNCDAQFKSNKLKSSMTGQSAIDSLKSLRKNYTKMAASQAQKLKNAITKKLIECESSDIANSSQPGSCSPANFDTGRSTFCAAAAKSCSTNMQACSTQTQQKVETLEKARTARVQNYNTSVTKHVAALKNLYEKSQSLYEGQIKTMQGGFTDLGVASFSLPEGIDSDPKTTKLAGFSEHEVFLEDPTAAFAAFKKNVSLLKGEVTKYQTALMKGVKSYAGEKERLYSSVSADAANMESNCMAAVSGFSKAMADKAKIDGEQMKQFGQKLSRFCKEYDRFSNEHPNGACAKGYDDIVEVGLEAAMKLGSANAGQAIAEYQQMCEEFNNASEDDTVNVGMMCDKLVKKTNCTAYETIEALGASKHSECAAAGAKPEYTAKYAVVPNSNPAVAVNCSAKDHQQLHCDKVEATGDCQDRLDYYAKLIEKDFRKEFKRGEILPPSITSSAPEYCQADANGNYRYNGKVFQQQGVGQTGGAVATGF